MALFLERVYPYVVAFAAGLLWFRFGASLPPGPDILGSSLTVGAILTGFLATAKAILMALDSPVMNRIRDTEYIKDLVSYLSQAVWLSFLFCGISLIGYFVDTATFYFGLVWIFVAVAMAAAFIRVVNIMLKILRHTPA